MALTTTKIQTITSDTAMNLIRAAIEQSAALVKPFCISVVDASGVGMAFHRIVGAPLHSEKISRDKAYTAVSFKAPSDAWFERAKPFGESGVAMVAAAVDNLVPMGGGVPIIVDGIVVGAVGVSGGTSVEDKQVAEGAIAAVLAGDAAPVRATMPATVAGYFAALRANDPAAWAANFAEDAVGHDPVGAAPLIGRAAFSEMLTGFLPTWGRFDGITEDEVFTAGNATSVRWTGRGISSSGRAVTWSGINTFHLADDGLIQTFYAVFDSANLTAQLAETSA